MPVTAAWRATAWRAFQGRHAHDRALDGAVRGESALPGSCSSDRRACSDWSRSRAADLLTLTGAKQSLGRVRGASSNVSCTRYRGRRTSTAVHAASATASLPLELAVSTLSSRSSPRVPVARGARAIVGVRGRSISAPGQPFAFCTGGLAWLRTCFGPSKSHAVSVPLLSQGLSASDASIMAATAAPSQPHSHRYARPRAAGLGRSRLLGRRRPVHVLHGLRK